MITQFISPGGKVTTTPESVEGIDENANFAAGLPTVSAGGRRRVRRRRPAAGVRGPSGGNTLSAEDMIVVQDYPQNLAIIGDLIAKLDVMPVQVLIEATIIRVDLNRTQTLGVNIGAVDTRGGVLGILGDASQFGSTAGFNPLKFLNANGTIQGSASISRRHRDRHPVQRRRQRHPVRLHRRQRLDLRPGPGDPGQDQRPGDPPASSC